MSSAIWWLILGLLVGWLIEWAIDWWYWRRPRESAQPALEPAITTQQPAREGPVLQQARAEVARLEGELETAREYARQSEGELESLRGQTADLARARAEVQMANEQASRHEAELEQLRAQLAAGDGAAGLRAELEAANALAAERQAEIERLRTQLADTASAAPALAETPAAPAPVVLSEPEQQGERGRNFATVMLSAEELAAHQAPASDDQKANGEPAATVLPEQQVTAPPDDDQPGDREPAATSLLEQQVAAPAARDPLIDINGIGPIYEQRLFEAGIYTFAALAALSPERIRAIIQPEKWQNIDPEQWIAEARQRAGLSE
jgi:predicted flap endonuclease-1-like 5' DNA nuclease